MNLLRASAFLFLIPLAALAANRVAMVFDDGPDPKQTPVLLEILAKADAVATFSYKGEQVAAYPELARAAAHAGHDFCNHSYTHPHLRTLGDDAVKSELSRTSEVMTQATGRPPSFFWAPFLETDDRVNQLVREASGLEHFPLKQVHFVSSDDWNVTKTNAGAIYHNATTDVRDLTVILFHEWRPETAAQLPAIIAELRRQGCTFVTFSEMAKLSAPAPAAAH